MTAFTAFLHMDFRRSAGKAIGTEPPIRFLQPKPGGWM